MKHYVYLIGNSAQDVYKIGMSNCPEARLSAFNVPFKLSVVYKHEVAGRDVAYELEAKLHKHYKAAHTHLEWFSGIGKEDFARTAATLEKQCKPARPVVSKARDTSLKPPYNNPLMFGPIDIYSAENIVNTVANSPWGFA